MNDQRVSYLASVPVEHGFRWITKVKQRWVLADPSEVRNDRLYLAANYDNLFEPFWGYHRALKDWGVGPLGCLIDEPDLYLEFASIDPTPEGVLKFADKYGFLERGFQDEKFRYLELNSDAYPDLAEVFKASMDTFLVGIETCSKWLSRRRGIYWLIDTWASAQSAEDRMRLLDNFGAANTKLDFRLRLEFGSDRPMMRLLAPTLSDMLDIQWGMAIAAEKEHRQCAECTNWFGVSVASARADKVYCSDACRMRAYRKRKAGKK